MSSNAAQLAGISPEVSPAVLIVVLNWNSPYETLTAVKSLLQMDYSNYRVVVVDNGSADNSLELLEGGTSDRVQLLRSPENLGYAGGCNLGFGLALQSGADYVWLLNNDTVAESGSLSSLVRVAEKDPRIGLVSPIIASLEEPARLISAGGIYDSKVPAYKPTRDLQLSREWATEYSNSIILLGTALLVKTSLIHAIGFLDSAMFAYWEDTDYSLRSNRAGYRNVVDFDSIVYHSEKFPRTSPHEIKPHYWYYLARNEIRFWKKHADGTALLKALWWAYQGQLRILNRLADNEISSRAVLSGLWHGWLGRSGPYCPDLHMPQPVASLILRHSRKYDDAQ